MAFRIRHLLSGVAIYATGSLVGQALYTFSVFNEWITVGATLAVFALFSLFAGMNIRPHTIRDVIPYSLTWAVFAVFLDAVLIVPAVGWDFLVTLDALVGYGIIALVPLFALYPHFGRNAPSSSVGTQ